MADSIVFQTAVVGTEMLAPGEARIARRKPAARGARPIGGSTPPPLLSLLPRLVCKRTVEALEALLEQARAGEVIGIAYSIGMPRQRYMVAVAGEFADNPTYARGAVAALEDELRYLVQTQDD